VTLAYVGLGSNLEQPAEQVRRALAELARIPDTAVRAVSSLYRSAPVGYAAQPDFVNAVAALDTGLGVEALLAELQAIEARHGRRRSFANAPRTLDLDLLLFGDASLEEQELTLPHPRMHERAFVLAPLLEIAPDIAIPGVGPAIEQLARCADQPVARLP
jgi:2-amino-4-hydroxy-6-hydroxymethyldihydropteridine diphosphokinase